MAKLSDAVTDVVKAATAVSDAVSGPARRDGRDTRWEQHRTERRTQILDAAVDVIERGEPGVQIHVREIAEKAGLGRPVIYRHFSDKADLDRAIAEHILVHLRSELLAELVLSGSIEQTILRVVSKYVGWAALHPALHRIAAQEPPTDPGGSELARTTDQLGDQIRDVLIAGAAVFGIELSEQDTQMLSPMAHGLVGQAFGAVRQWLHGPVREPAAEVLADYLARSIWFQIDGLARARGVELDPRKPIEDLILAAVADTP